MANDLSSVSVMIGLAITVLTVLGQIISALLERSGPIRLRHWAEESEGRVLEVFEQPVRFELYRATLSWLARISAIALFLALHPVVRAVAANSVAWTFVVVALILAATELLSRHLVGRDPESALRGLTILYRISLVLLSPVTYLLAPLFPRSMVERQEDEDEDTDDEIEAYINVGTQEGILEPGEEDLIQRVIDFGDSLVKSVVTPRIDMVCAPIDSDLDSLAELFLSSKHSRIPVFEETVDEIVGVLHIRDLLLGLRSQPRPDVSELAMSPYFVPETKPLNELLSEFQAHRQQLAIVVDEYGGTAGRVTVEDLLEEIVGEIEDEHDASSPVTEALLDGKWRLDGRVPLETLEDLFDLEVDDEPYETIGGLIFGRLGYVPEPGETLEVGDLRLDVERVEARRIQSVIVERIPTDSLADDD